MKDRGKNETKDVIMEERHRAVTLLALKVKEGTMRKAVQEAS